MSSWSRCGVPTECALSGEAVPIKTACSPSLACMLRSGGPGLGTRGVSGHWCHVAAEKRGSGQHLPALIEAVIRFALKFSPLKRGEAERWKGLLTEEVSLHKMKGNFRGIYPPSSMV